MRGRSLNVEYHTISLPLSELRDAARHADATINDAFLAAVAGGMRRYHEHHHAAAHELRVNMPVNRRAHDSTQGGGNSFVPARFRLPIGITDPMRRIDEIGRRAGRVRGEPALARLDSVFGLLNRAPAIAPYVLATMAKSNDLHVSNVTGPATTLYCAGAQIQAMYPFGPLPGAALNVSLVSYVGQLGVAVTRWRQPAYSASISAAYFSAIGLRLSFIVGVSSSPPGCQSVASSL
jgi:diacylglycerol O-acyltransferase / wax synthase